MSLRFHLCPALVHNRQHKTVRDWEALQDRSQELMGYPHRAFDMEPENHSLSPCQKTIYRQLTYNHIIQSLYIFIIDCLSFLVRVHIELEDSMNSHPIKIPETSRNAVWPKECNRIVCHKILKYQHWFLTLLPFQCTSKQNVSIDREKPLVFVSRSTMPCLYSIKHVENT